MSELCCPSQSFFRHFYFLPAQLVRGLTLNDILDKPWSQVPGVFPSIPLVRAFIYIARRVQHSDFSAYCARQFSSNIALSS